MNQQAVRIGCVCLCLALLSSLAVAPAAAQSSEEAFLVELEASGDADVSMTFSYDLDSEDEQAAFEELGEDEDVQTEVTERFENRMSTVAADAGEATDREMSIGEAGIEFQRTDNVGLVTLSVRWSGLAAVDDDRLTVTEPFASGFEPEQPLTVVAPDGYSVASVTPEPGSIDETSATWEAGTTLTDFEFVATADADAENGAEEDTPDEDATEDAAGFGVGVAVLALLGLAMFAARRRR